jgi:hypothetical protein
MQSSYKKVGISNSGMIFLEKTRYVGTCVKDGSGILCFLSLRKQRYSVQPDPCGHAKKKPQVSLRLVFLKNC